MTMQTTNNVSQGIACGDEYILQLYTYFVLFAMGNAVENAGVLSRLGSAKIVYPLKTLNDLFSIFRIH